MVNIGGNHDKDNLARPIGYFSNGQESKSVRRSNETPGYGLREAETEEPEQEPEPRPLGPRVGGLAQPRKLNDTTFSGYEDVIVKAPLIELTTEDLNNMLNGGVDYYATDGNTVSSKPPDVDGFGMKVVSLGTISRSQELTCKNSGKLFRRIWDGNSFTPWSAAYTTENKPKPDDISGGVKIADIAITVDDKFISKTAPTELPELETSFELTPET